MRIALVHYHMRRGGVASVIAHQAAALMEAGDEVLVISGDPPEAPLVVPSGRQIPVAVVEGLRYDRFQMPAAPSVPPAEAGKTLAEDINAAITGVWGRGADIIHVHNPLICKTAALLPALNILNKRGLRLLLQNHDLAEDFRPDVYVDGEDYPANCHYAVINSRDYSFLHRAGLKLEGLHLIPNEVVSVMAAGGLERNRYLYPVRAIRRKNLGEALLASLFIPKGRTVAVTLPPTTDQDEAVYQNWVKLAGELELPVEFEVGTRERFADVFGSALAVLSTSVKEGFGFSFLEPWTADRAVLGRRIEYVCRDFEDAGISFAAPSKKTGVFYKSINIPMDYIALPVLKNKMERAMTAIYEAFGLEPPAYAIRMMNDMIFTEQTIDFGRLDEELQTGIIRILASNDVVYREIAALNPFLMGLADWQSDENLIAENNRRIREAYGKERIAAILRRTYQSVMNTPILHKLSKVLLLELYLDPLRLSLVGVSHV
ncbi:MAG: glycosyltransferase family 1 protein [Treponema sp.]|nr:glycosyltransferase family 1 protein [Treponema sp.]